MGSVRACVPQRGFTYVGLLLAIALAGAGLAGIGQLWSTAVQREREARLLAIGLEFQRALKSYYDASPGAKMPPARLEDLLEDRRLPVTRRHLRRIYIDPMTGGADWGVVRAGDRIVGVHSLSDRAPLARMPGLLADATESAAVTYRDWVFQLDATETPGSR